MILVVSGAPRSGTSLMMQMLAAGGMALLTDGQREPDSDNPRGYYEWERIKRLAREPECVAEAEGKAVKIVSPLLAALPRGREYRIVFMERPVEEVAASQEVMIGNRGTAGGGLSAAAMAAALRTHLAQARAALAAREDTAVLPVEYHALLRDARAEAERIADFAGAGLDPALMAAQVDPALYRRRGAG